ncbi:MAG: hypothetical protein KatS3mg054_0136 [Chloroflexus sp.]|nr:MAG: hypothetical protein KatS3mg054_0136 [Chloroflexus sp.]
MKKIVVVAALCAAWLSGCAWLKEHQPDRGTSGLVLAVAKSVASSACKKLELSPEYKLVAASTLGSMLMLGPAWLHDNLPKTDVADAKPALDFVWYAYHYGMSFLSSPDNDPGFYGDVLAEAVRGCIAGLKASAAAAEAVKG